MSAISEGMGDIEKLDENLRKWFKEKWVRFGPDGKIRGACARGDDSEGKPKCLPQKKAQNLGKKGRKYAASKKRREDPNPERTGKAKNVATKKKTNEGVPFDECPKCRGPIVHESMMNEKQDACYHKVKSRYKVWPSAYASGALVQCRKKGASNWGTGGKKNESNIMKGIVNEEESVLVLYIDGKPSAKYAIGHEAKTAMERLQAKFPNKKLELKREMREAQIGEAKAKPYVKPFIENGKQVGWKSSDGYHVKYWQMFAKDSAIKHAKLNPADVNEGEVVPFKKKQSEHDKYADAFSNQHGEEHRYGVGWIECDYCGDVKCDYDCDESQADGFNEDYTGEFAAEKTPAINPYGGLKDNQFRGAISEEPTTSGPIGTQPGGWRRYSPKPAGEIDEAKKSEFRQKTEQQQYAKLEKINNSSLPHWAKEYLILLNDPKGKVFKAAYYSFPKGQDAREEVAEYIMSKYKVPLEMLNKVKYGEMAHIAIDRAEDRNYDFDVPSVHEDTAYAGGMGQGGNAGQSYRKFKPKSAGTFKEARLDKNKISEYNVDDMLEKVQDCLIQSRGQPKRTLLTKLYNIVYHLKRDHDGNTISREELKLTPWLGKHGLALLDTIMDNTSKEEQLDEKCWDTHKQVGMKTKGGKQVPNCVPKESAIMKGINRLI
jgi:hypothetical protein